MRTLGTTALLFLSGGALLYSLAFASAQALPRHRQGDDPALEAALLAQASILPLVLSAGLTIVGMLTAYHCPFAHLPPDTERCPLPFPHICLHSRPLVALVPLLRRLEVPAFCLLSVGMVGYAAALFAAHLLPLPRASALFGMALTTAPSLPEKALRHEIAHLARLDHVASAFVELGRALFFWLPPARALAVAWRRAVERAASKEAVKCNFKPRALLSAASVTVMALFLPTFHCAAEALLGLWP